MRGVHSRIFMAMSNKSHGYEELPHEQIDDPDGARAVFTKRNGSPPLFTVAFFKTYKGADDAQLHTSFFTLKSLEALRRVVSLAETRLSELAADAESARKTAPTQSANRR